MTETNNEMIGGLPIHLNHDGQLILAPNILIEERKVRTLDELIPVCLDKNACQSKETAYEMFNGLMADKDQKDLSGLPIRYELTLFPEKMIGREFIKTLGHIHSPDPVTGIDPPEICEVLIGRAHFLFSKLDMHGPCANDVFCVEVLEGEMLVIPPGYDHLTINPGPGPMLFSDVVWRETKTDYSRLSEAGGAPYFEVSMNGMPSFLPNPSYQYVSQLRRLRPKPLKHLQPAGKKSLYQTFTETKGEGWEFLVRPDQFFPQFPDLNSLFIFA